MFIYKNQNSAENSQVYEILINIDIYYIYIYMYNTLSIMVRRNLVYGKAVLSILLGVLIYNDYIILHYHWSVITHRTPIEMPMCLLC